MIKIVIFLAQKIQNVALNLPQFFCTKKCTLYKIPGMSPFFAPLYLMRLLFLICSQDENVQEYKRAKKGPGFPPSFSSQMSLWAAEGKSGVARQRSALTALFTARYECYPNVISRVLGPRTQSRVTGSNPPCLGEKKNSLVLLSCHRSKLSWRKPSWSYSAAAVVATTNIIIFFSVKKRNKSRGLWQWCWSIHSRGI